ncbi:MAG: hypothetical protein RLZZ519_3132, partial [Bacteroidota bacterium]
MKKLKYPPGTIVKIPLQSGEHTYGRRLLETYVEVYDAKSEDDSEDFSKIVLKPKLFIVSVYTSTFKKALWEEVGFVELDDESRKLPLEFMQDIVDPRKCAIVDFWGNETPATIDECRGLESHSIWNANAVEDRINAYYEGRIDPGT